MSINRTTSFWKQLRKPFFCLAPMADVTDAALRKLLVNTGKPHVMWTEFVSCEAICHSKESREKMLINLKYHEKERPIVAQLFGSKPEQFYHSAQLLADLGFDGIDINMGCPDKNVCKQGSGSALMLQPSLAQEIVYQSQRGGNGLPVSVKTRIGYNEINHKEWVKCLLDTNIDALTIHGRTRKEMSDVPAHWDIIEKISHIRNESSNSSCRLIGNGDVQSLVEAHDKVQQFNVDGVMLGRAIFGNPWLFNPDIDCQELTMNEKLDKLMEHIEIFEEILSLNVSYHRLRKSLPSYINQMPQSKSIRMLLQQTKTIPQAKKIINEYRHQLNQDKKQENNYE